MYQLSRPATATQINPGLMSFVVRLFNTNRKLIRNGKNNVQKTRGLRTCNPNPTASVHYDELVYSFHNIPSKNSRDQIKKQWWKLVKTVTGSKKTSAVPPLRHDGHIYNKTNEKVQLLNNICCQFPAR